MRSMCRSASTGQTSNGRWMNRNMYPINTQRMNTSRCLRPGAPLLDRRGVPHGDGTGGGRLDDDAPRADDTLLADVGHDDGPVADPAVAADADRGERAALLL